MLPGEFPARVRAISIALVLLATPVLAGAANDPVLEAKVHAYLNPIVERDLISGSVLIARGGEVLLAKGYGPANREYDVPNRPDTKFRLGSITKQFTAMAILQLQHQGHLTVDDTLDRFFPDYPEGEKITLHHLLTHTSGVPNYNGFPDYSEKLLLPWKPDRVIEWFQQQPLRFEPGEKFEYSNSGFILLTAIIEKVSGKPYKAFLKENIFDPLGMNDSGQDCCTTILKNRATGHFNPDGRVHQALYRNMPFTGGAGSLYSTVMDLARWDRALYDDELVPRDLLERMFTPHAGNYGYGWFIDERFGRRMIHHGGAINGFLADIQRFPEDETLVVALFNYESTFAKEAFRGLSAIALGEAYEPLLEETVWALNPTTLWSFEGDYEVVPGYVVTVTAEQGDLFLEVPEEKKCRAVPLSDRRFFFEDVNVMVTFEPGANGEAEGLRLRNGAHVFPARRLEWSEVGEIGRRARL